MKPTPQCQFLDVEVEEMDLQTNIEILDRFHAWAKYFHVRTCIPKLKVEIKKVIRTGVVPVGGIVVWER